MECFFFKISTLISLLFFRLIFFSLSFLFFLFLALDECTPSDTRGGNVLVSGLSFRKISPLSLSLSLYLLLFGLLYGWVYFYIFVKILGEGVSG